jgi:hypothetical protein
VDEDPKLGGVCLSNQDRCGVVILARAFKENLICCGNKAKESINHLAKEWVYIMISLETIKKGGTDGVLALYFDKADLQMQRVELADRMP